MTPSAQKSAEGVLTVLVRTNYFTKSIDKRFLVW